MLIVNAIAAMWIVPAWCVVFKPAFLKEDENEESPVNDQVSMSARLDCRTVGIDLK